MTKGETRIKIGCGCGSLDGYRAGLAKIPGITEAEVLAMANRYRAALAKLARAPVMLHPTQFRDLQSDLRHTAMAASPSAPRSVVFGLALAGWAS